MHQIHTTPGFIIDSRPYGDAGKIISIYTKNLGLVFATAQGIRLEKSKLRYHTQEYSFGQFSLVRGKEYWRLTSAQELESGKWRVESGTKKTQETDLPSTLYPLPSHTELIARIALLLRRLLHGEEPNLQLFECISAANDFLRPSPGLCDERLRTFESITVARMLHALGYIGNDIELADTFKGHDVSIEMLDGLAAKRKDINQHINKALKESQL